MRLESRTFVVAGIVHSGIPEQVGEFSSPRLTAGDLGEAVLIGIIIGVLGAAYPTRRVTRMTSTIALAAT